jgi:outer membrane protein assembly factor BamD
MVVIATFVAVNLLLPAAQSLYPTQVTDRTETVALAPHDIAADRHAGRHLDIGRSYFGEREYLAALNRLKVVVTQFHGSRHVEEALWLLTEAYLALGQDADAQTATAVLRRKYPNGRWSAEATDSLRAAGLKPAEDAKSWISRALQ